jgi:hypothetical protein
MINKSHLQSVISKYYLNGIVESVKWKVKDNILSIDFMSPTRDMIGKVEFNKFDVKDCELAIFDTSQLNKLLAITNSEVLINFNKNKLYISDNQYNLQYSLADPLLIEKVGKVETSLYHIEFELDQEQIGSIIKAIEALPNSNTLCLNKTQTIIGEDILEFIFGERQDYSNKIVYSVNNLSILNPIQDFILPFNSEIFKNIFRSNRDCENIKFQLNVDGLIKINFSNETINSEYFLIRRQDY